MKKTAAILAIALLALSMGACRVTQTEKGEMPEVEVKEGNLPKYDVDGPQVEVGTKETTVTVPDIDISTPDDPDYQDDDLDDDQEGGGNG